MTERKLPAWISARIVIGGFVALLWFELRRPLHRSVESEVHRTARNLAVAAAGAIALQLSERPAIAALAGLVEQRRWGLLRLLDLPAWMEVLFALLLLDYTLYIWHVLTHRVPLLWRFHLVHHVDLDVDASAPLCAFISASWHFPFPGGRCKSSR